MTAILYIKIFAWISIVALCCSICSTYWLPMLTGAIVITLLIRLVR
ncbi:MAG: hypothetical protein V4689_01130 [Verrucomicrobiota bacterium]